MVVAHPDDETFGLGAVADRFAAGGTAVHVLCFTHGEASTLNENHAELRRARDWELRQAAAELGVVTVTLLDYPDGHLAAGTAWRAVRPCHPPGCAPRRRRPAARVRAIQLRVIVPGGVPAERRAAMLAVASHCTVHNTLRQEPGITIDLA